MRKSGDIKLVGKFTAHIQHTYVHKYTLSNDDHNKNGMTVCKNKVCRVRIQRCSPPANHSVNWRESSP